MAFRHIGLIAAGSITLISLTFTQSAPAQAAPQTRPAERGGGQAPRVVSPEVSADRKITVRLNAPQAQSVRLSVVDLANLGKGEMAKNANDVWELTIGPVPAGAYRYFFIVNGVNTVDPRNYATSEADSNVHSLVIVPGSDVIDIKNVPHGAVAAVHYQSKTLNTVRRMHIYTPPGYENGTDKYPVLYLLHGSLDSDETWMSEGRANFIIDNLIDQKQVVPMIVVMPAGLTNHGQPSPGARGADPFGDDFMGDIKPYVESHYRSINDRGHRAIAGLSMGGGQSLNIAFSHLAEFSHVGIFSSGTTGNGGASGTWEENHRADLDSADLKDGLKVLWMRIGAEDGAVPRAKAAAELLKKHGFNPSFRISEGGHNWITWRDCLQEFAPLLFQS